ncbi:MAG: amino acid adenylation domain-containing protein [Eggerthellaceae bacterium]|nr:amino acid adenylation domain-containing protein [Eggerthellaceae bacterium]
MSRFVDQVDRWGVVRPKSVAFCNSAGEQITYGQLKEQSDALACALSALPEQAQGAPVVVFGHKSPFMIVCFLACAKAGCAYVPADVCFPLARIDAICAQLGGAVVLDTSNDGLGSVESALRIVALEELRAMATAPAGLSTDAQPAESAPSVPESVAQSLSDQGSGAISDGALEPAHGDDTFYILFTSGSTGAPKGVEVTVDCVDNFCDFMTSQFTSEEPQVFFNRVPFSFDVSLTDMALGLTRGDKLFALVEESERSYAALFDAVSSSNATWWISTPSAIEMCLADPAFSQALMPRLHTVFLAGEVLKPQTVRELYDRFPQVRVMNAYGPTESTDIVSWCWIEPSMLDGDAPLPIGRAKTGTQLLVLDPETLQPVPNGARGELFIVGDTVAKGYFGRPDLTDAAFGCCPPELSGGQRSYRTGDEVLLSDDGFLYYFGRLDQQVKVHGYRIELGEVESVLAAQPQIAAVCVVPAMRNGAIAHLVAFAVPVAGVAGDFALTRVLKAQAGQVLPDYMIPRSFRYVESLPQNANGKYDRKALAEILQ